MVPIDLLLVGDALDGPEGEIVEIRSLDHAVALFGGYHYAETTLASGATGFTLPHTPWDESVLPLQEDSDGFYVPRTLFELALSGDVLSWTANGDWDRYQDADPSAEPRLFFKYPAVPGATSLLKAIYACQGVPGRIHALRLGGTRAQVTSGEWSFFARYPGSRYNGTTVEVSSGGVVTVTPAAGTGRTREYTPDSDVDLYNLLLKDLARGWQPLYLSGPASSSSFTLPSGTYILADGADGTCDPDTLDAYLETDGFSGVDVLCLSGWDTDTVRASTLLACLSGGVYPTLVVAQATTTGAALSGVEHTETNLVSVGFRHTYDLGSARERIDDAAPLVAALIASRRFGITLAPLPQGPALPAYSADELHAVAAAGHIVPFHSISRGDALWHAVTGSSRWPVSTFRGLQEVARVLFAQLEPYLGDVLLDLAPVRAGIEAGLNTITSGVVLSWRLYREESTLYAEVDFLPHGEVRSIQFTVTLGGTA